LALPGPEDGGLEYIYSEKIMMFTPNMKQAGGEDCLIVCQINGGVDIPVRLIKLAGFIVVFFYKALKWLVFETVAPPAGSSCGEPAMASIRADAMRPLAYKLATSPNRA